MRILEAVYATLRRLLCEHRYYWWRNIYGDEINTCGGKRSLWVCYKCDKTQLRDKLQ